MAKKQIITFTTGSHNRIKLRGKRMSSGSISLYLDQFIGTRKELNKEGIKKIKTIRKLEYLDLKLFENPKSDEQRVHNSETLRLAESIRGKKQESYFAKKENLRGASIRKINFLDYFQNYEDTYKNKDIRLVKYSLVKFREFLDKEYLQPHEVTEELVIDYKNHLQDKLNGDTPYNYFSKFKQMCKHAYKEGVLLHNPAEDVTIIRSEGLKKDILNFDEIKLLTKTDCSNLVIKKAFLFCLNTGLRHVDIKSLTWRNIDFKAKQLKVQQSKVKHTSKKSFVIIDLNKNALAILKLQEKGKPDDIIFILPTVEGSNGVLKTWVKAAGIDKRITWHSARHSFGTNLLINKTDIKTVSSLLGHSSLRHTEKYMHLVDEIRKKAVNTLPQISMDKLK